MLKESGQPLLPGVLGRLSGDRAPSGDAPLDPFGADVPSRQQLAQDFKFLRASPLAEEEAASPRFQELWRERPDTFLRAGDDPALVLFVSHRWQTSIQPDPKGFQADVIRSFLQTVAAVATAASHPPEARRELLASLRVHGVLQAGLLLGNQRGFGVADEQGLRDFCETVRKAHEPSKVGAAIVDGIAVWYDFSCLPQGANESRVPADTQEQRVLERALRRLHTLILASTVLVLRASDDDYGSRAWCVAELSFGQPAWRHIVLRTDL